MARGSRQLAVAQPATNVDQLFWMRVRQRPQQGCVDGAEECRRGADADRERENRHRRKSRRAAHAAQRGAEVLWKHHRGESYEASPEEAYYFKMCGWVGEMSISTDAATLEIQNVMSGHDAEVK